MKLLIKSVIGFFLIFFLANSSVIHAQSPTPVTQIFLITSGSDDVNQDNTGLDASASTVWLGNGSSASNSFTGLRFNGVSIPRGTTIISSHLEVYSPQNLWISMAFGIAAEATGNSPAFSSSSLPSQRTLTNSQVNHASDEQWLTNTWYSLNEMAPVIQEVVNRTDWQAGNNLSVILKGTGGPWGRKWVTSYNGNSNNAPRLVVTYTSDAPVNTPTPSATPTSAPTLTPFPATADQRYLLLNSNITDAVDNAVLRLGTVSKHPANPLFGRDEPWAQAWDNAYPAVVFDPEVNLYKLWYNPFIDLQNEFTALAYAQSSDGISWVKPNLGLVEWGAILIII